MAGKKFIRFSERVKLIPARGGFRMFHRWVRLDGPLLGETVSIQTPKGPREYRILEVR